MRRGGRGDYHGHSEQGHNFDGQSDGEHTRREFRESKAECSRGPCCGNLPRKCIDQSASNSLRPIRRNLFALGVATERPLGTRLEGECQQRSTSRYEQDDLGSCCVVRQATDQELAVGVSRLQSARVHVERLHHGVGNDRLAPDREACGELALYLDLGHRHRAGGNHDRQLVGRLAGGSSRAEQVAELVVSDRQRSLHERAVAGWDRRQSEAAGKSELADVGRLCCRYGLLLAIDGTGDDFSSGRELGVVSLSKNRIDHRQRLRLGSVRFDHRYFSGWLCFDRHARYASDRRAGCRHAGRNGIFLSRESVGVSVGGVLRLDAVHHVRWLRGGGDRIRHERSRVDADRQVTDSTGRLRPGSDRSQQVGLRRTTRPADA